MSPSILDIFEESSQVSLSQGRQTYKKNKSTKKRTRTENKSIIGPVDCQKKN